MKLVGLTWGALSVVSLYFLVDVLKPDSDTANASPRKPRQTHNQVASSASPVATEITLPASRGGRLVQAQTSDVPAAPPFDHLQPEPSERDVVLEQRFQTDELADRESHARQSSVQGLFEAANLGNDGRLLKLSCKRTMCRGELELANRSKDRGVFERTLMSQEFSQTVNTAFTVTERRKFDDGHILATFFLHPDVVPEETSSELAE